MSNKVIKVAQVIGMSDGGVASIIMSLYRAIDKSKVQFDFLVESESKIINKKEIESLGGSVIIIPSYKNLSSYIKSLKKIFVDGGYDIVHANMSTLNVFPLLAAKKAGVNVRISHSHSTANKLEFKKTILKTILKPFSKCFATEYFGCSKLAATYLFGKKEMKNNNVHIINNGVDIEKYNFNAENRSIIRKKYNMDDDFVVGHIGRMQKQKNQLFLINIFKEITKIIPNSKLIMIGDGPLKEDIISKINSLDLQKKVILTGNVDNPNQFYSAMDCFLLPSLYEGLPIVGVEAQINGLSCYFSTYITDEAKVIDQTKFISLNDTPEKWAKEISLGSKTHKTNVNVDKFNIDLVADNLLNLYYEFLKKYN